MIRYSCHSENFGVTTPEQTFSFISVLGFDCIDVASRTLIPQKSILAYPLDSARRFHELSNRYSLPLSELFLSSVEVDGIPISPASPEAGSSDFCKNFDTVCTFAEHAGFSSIMGTAGPAVDSVDYAEIFHATAKTLREQVSIAADHGLEFHVEPYRLSLLNNVEACLQMAEAVPGLKFTLDFLHFQIQGIPLSESLKLLPVAGHLHARQAKFQVGKCDFIRGEIDYSAVVRAMKCLNWSGDIAMEFWCSPELEAAGVQAVEQNLVMRYCLKSLFSQDLDESLELFHDQDPHRP